MTETSELSFEAFAQQLLMLLDEGRFVATYKFAVLLALLDVLQESADKNGKPPKSIGTRELARKVVSIYWPHTRPFAKVGSAPRQSTQGQAEIVGSITAFRETTIGDSSAPLSAARHMEPEAFERLVRRVEFKLIEMPLGRLQLIGNQNHPFIYTVSWDTRPKLSTVKQDDFDGRLHLVPGAGNHLLHANPLVRPLIQHSWALRVRSCNDALAGDELESFLFGEDRISLAPVTAGLRELAEARCFYCGKTVKANPHIDHFIPFARHIDNGLSNLVFAHDACNAKKSWHLAAEPHLERWATRLTDAASLKAMEELAAGKNWEHDPAKTLGAARAIYLTLPAQHLLWQEGSIFTPIDRKRTRTALSVESGRKNGKPE